MFGGGQQAVQQKAIKDIIVTLNAITLTAGATLAALTAALL